MDHLVWQKSSTSSDKDVWIEIASEGDSVYIRQSDDPSLIVTTTRVKFRAWVLGAKAGEFDHFVQAAPQG
ncbi:DUF397 domain-containing protein [Kitasatospora brasiliensis]|uniref:DUF397 domain-containing protein n=1 Tax=Kitasatospora brasiliensis TaxID=3058040 RepID=UPI002930533B|nr:DUF397 domain-containing protein [Kitasatospora sp. K002]